MNRRVLVVGYCYPDLNMGGVRTRRLCRLLPKFGWDPVVLTHPFDAEKGPPTPPGVRIEQVAAPDLAQAYQSLTRAWRRPVAEQKSNRTPTVQNIGLTSAINRWLMIPDKYRPWLRPALRRGAQLLREQKFDAIFASLDPRTTLLIAGRLAAASGVPAVLEYRDLWVGNPYYHLTQPTALHRWMHGSLERKAIRQSTRVSAVCRGIRDYLSQAHAANLRAPVDLNYNFYDPDEYPARTPQPRDRPFVVSYTGNLYASRTPNQFLEGLHAFVTRHQLTPAQFQFRWAGGLSGVDGLDEVLARTQIKPYVDFLGQVPHRAALQLLVESDAALLLQAPDDAIHIPGKLFESLGARVPILALSNPCETTQILADCRAGVVSPYDIGSIADALTGLYRRWQRQEAWNFDEARCQEYSADVAGAKLAKLFDDAASARPPSP